MSKVRQQPAGCVAATCCLQEAEGGALASYTGTLRYSSGLIADQKRTAAALVRVSKIMGKVRQAPAGMGSTVRLQQRSSMLLAGEVAG